MVYKCVHFMALVMSCFGRGGGRPLQEGQRPVTAQNAGKKWRFWPDMDPLYRLKSQKSALVKSYLLDAHFFWHRVEGVRNVGP